MSELRVEDRDAVRWIILNRPDSRNALTVPLVEQLANVCRDAGRDPNVRVIVISGDGGAFCSGLDLKVALAEAGDAAASVVHFHNLIRHLASALKPTIAAIDGAAAGFGADLALACDLRFATTRATLGERFVRIGLMPDGGGTWFLPQVVGRARAFELLYEGRMISAEEAAEIGMVNRVFPTDGFREAMQTYAATLAKGPPLAYARIKHAVLHATTDLEDSLCTERDGQLALLKTADFQEGVTAFLERREARFQGK